jgi:hypothetical protein
MSFPVNPTISSRRRSLFAPVLLATSFLLLGNLAKGAENAAAEETANNMLNALGGRTAWAELKNTVNGSQQNRVGEPTEVYAVITMDFDKPRFRIETTAQDLHLIRVIDGDNNWRLRRTGNIENVPEALVKEELRWYEGHLYRTIHRIADRDPAISLNLDDQGRLQVFANGERIMWFRLDAKSEPYAFGSHADDVGSLLGPWDLEQDGIRHPIWVSSSDGTWRAAVKSLRVNVPMRDHMFDRPALNDQTLSAN